MASKAAVYLKTRPYYRTGLGAAYLGDSLALMRSMPSDSVNVVMTSPPFALQRQKEYGNVTPAAYTDWLYPFAEQIHRILRTDGSLVLDLGGSWTKGHPTRTLYQYDTVLRLTDALFHLAQDFYWFNPAKLPSPAEWVTVRRVRVKDSVNTVWWFSKTENPKADNRKVKTPYSESMQSLLRNGYRAKLRPSGHDISSNFSKDNGGAIPPNLLKIANTESNSAYQRRCREAAIKVHPARFPEGLPEFFIKFLTDEGDLVLDPFAGSNVTGCVAERLGRRWIAIELDETYVKGSKFRFDSGAEIVRQRARSRVS